MALALIALAQNSNGLVLPNEQLYHLTEIPVPHFQIQQKQTSLPPPPPPPPAPVYQQEDFADFTSFEQIEEHNESSNDVTLLDFDENHLYPPDIKATSSETQSIASLDLPIPTMNTSYQDNTSQKGISDNISFCSSINNEMVHAGDTHSLHSITSSEPSKLGKYYQYFHLFKTIKDK
jgi:hypothetical protein